MKTIIALIRSVSGMIDLKFDDNTTLSIDRNIVEKSGLKVSQRIDDGTLDKLLSEADGAKCYDAALRYLDFRSRSVDELKRHLLSKHIYSTAVIDRTIERLKNSKLLDDTAFAKAWVNDRIRYKPKSRLMIQRELMQKGISEDNIADATTGIDDVASAYQAGLKKAKLLRSEDHLKFSIHLSAYLGRRGYSGEVVRSVVNKLWLEMAGK